MQELRSALQNAGLALIGLGGIPLTASIAVILDGKKVPAWLLVLSSVIVGLGVLLILVVLGWAASATRKAGDYEAAYEAQGNSVLVTVTNHGPPATFQVHVVKTTAPGVNPPWALSPTENIDLYERTIVEGQSAHFRLLSVGAEYVDANGQQRGTSFSFVRMGPINFRDQDDARICVSVVVSSNLVPKRHQKTISAEINRDALVQATVTLLQAECP